MSSYQLFANLFLYFGSQLFVIVAVFVRKWISVLLVDDVESATLGKQHWKGKSNTVAFNICRYTTHYISTRYNEIVVPELYHNRGVFSTSILLLRINEKERAGYK